MITPTTNPPSVTNLKSLEDVTDLAAPLAAAAERLRLAAATVEAEKLRAAIELRRTLMQLGCEVALDAPRRDALARVLYWRHTDIPVGDIVAALGFPDQRSVLRVAGPVDSGIPCDRCDESLVATSRTGLVELQKLGTGRSRYERPVCDPCRHALAVADVFDDDFDSEPSNEDLEYFDERWPEYC